MVNSAFFVLGVLFFAMAWVNYLNLDGVKFHYLNKRKEKKTINRIHKIKQPIDFTDEEPPLDDLLGDDEKTITTLISNIAAGLCFILPSIFSLVFHTIA
jgi:hypothetical protein